VRLITIWTGTNEIMELVIQSEFYKEILAEKPRGRDVEADAEGAELPDEKIYNVEGTQLESNKSDLKKIGSTWKKTPGSKISEFCFISPPSPASHPVRHPKT
jgi:hypothetical protein